MCVQCAAGAMAAGSAALGTRHVLLARVRAFVAPRRRRAVTASLALVFVLGAGAVPGTAHRSAPPPPAAAR